MLAGVMSQIQPISSNQFLSIPRVFISYSHDSIEHKRWVLNLATRLRSAGVDAIIDQWELGPGDDIPQFMERELRIADYVIMVCSESYVEKANSGVGGVGYEKMIVTSDLLSRIDSNKVIPIIRQNGTSNVPTFLQSKMHINMSRLDAYEAAIDELLRSLLQAPLFQKPEIGNNPYTVTSVADLEPSSSATREVMRALGLCHEATSYAYVAYDDVRNSVDCSRALLDLTLNELVSAEYIRTNTRADVIYLLPSGLMYILEHGLA